MGQSQAVLESTFGCAIMGKDEDPNAASTVRRTVVLDGFAYALEARQVSGGWFCSWRCETCQAVGAPSGTLSTSESAILAAKMNLKMHHRDSHSKSA
jgi:hypothetical protein